ncbi:colicin E3/pyocin S6 family cytotoxin [Duganella sacchari]|uniref:colicin E3/pyocin S6 family cytotoxin n=1 Tax=Duganella sacchari TaxID=551987 RepID=UPI0009333703|nr:colicin E3/pyocin S6 family cytotoxin [Duganella sacchari]
MAPIPIPKPSYLEQCVYLGARNGEKPWISRDSTKLYTWNWTHGEIEVFNQRGRHLGVIDAVTGTLIKNAVAGRKIDV